MVLEATLAEQHVAFTGKLACLTRAQAAELVRQHGGIFEPGVTRQTDILVVGQEGWPLQKDGKPSKKLERAQRSKRSQGRPVILTEEEWLVRLGLDQSCQEIHKHFSLPQLCRLLKIPRDRLRAWLRWDLVQPVETRLGVPYFDFRQVTGLKTLWELGQAGVPMERLRRSLEQLAGWLPSLGYSLTQLQLLERNGRLLWRLEEGSLVEPSGQMQLNFDDKEEAVRLSHAAEMSADDWYREGIVFEQVGQLDEAVRAYRQALYVGGPGAEVAFNLANALYAQGQLGQAAERYRQAVEIDHALAEAWNNLGNTLLELGETQEALQAYREAVKIDPALAETHYNLADALQTMGQVRAARKHWQIYLKLEQLGPWAEYARKALGQS